MNCEQFSTFNLCLDDQKEFDDKIHRIIKDNNNNEFKLISKEENISTNNSNNNCRNENNLY